MVSNILQLSFSLCLYLIKDIMFLPWISKKSSANTGGPLSIGLPEPLNTRPVKNKPTWNKYT